MKEFDSGRSTNLKTQMSIAQIVLPVISCPVDSLRFASPFIRSGLPSPTIPSNNLQSQKPAPTGILQLIDRTQSQAYSREHLIFVKTLLLAASF
ncbi:hypothetical protein [Microcoleus sp. F4-D5]|uniref:hypothetical protein n=1 Tax=Microcoleus sp. F4-D5 TaxID=2818760 RepID=UPI002FD4B03D